MSGAPVVPVGSVIVSKPGEPGGAFYSFEISGIASPTLIDQGGGRLGLRFDEAPLPPPSPGGETLVLITPTSLPPPVLFHASVESLAQDVSVLVEVPFTDPSATLRVGTSLSPSEILSSAQVNLTVAGEYAAPGLARLVAGENLVLGVNVGSSVSGRAVLRFTTEASP